MIEDELRAHYAAIASDLDADNRVLTAVLDDRARSWNVRTGLAVSGSVAMVAALTVGLVLLSEDGGTSHQNESSIPALTSAAASTADAGNSASSAPVLMPTTPQVAVQTLIDLVAVKGKATTPTGRAVANSSLGEIVFDDGHGAAMMSVALTWKGTGPKDAVPQACRPSATCQVLPDGNSIGYFQGPEYPNGGHSINSTEWSVQLYRPSDGLEIDISEWNAPAAKDSPITRPVPPFTIDELTTIADSPIWSATAPSTMIAADAKLFVADSMPTGAASPSAG
jgi:hypothetical protein